MKIVDLFSGCGGLSLGFQNAGFEILAAFENWDTAIECYKRNFNHPIVKCDLSDSESAIEAINCYSPDIIIGGPPCQDFSHAGKRIEADRADLTESYAKIIASIKPLYFVMENVDRAQKSHAYEKARSIFKDAGYGLTEIVLDASKCGVPQKRKRFFCIGSISAFDGFMLDIINSKISDKEMTLHDYFGDALDFEYYYRHPRNYNRRAIFSIYEPAPTMRGVNRPVPKGYPGHPKDACPISDEVRALTTLERSLIQTFPPAFKWSGNKTDTEQMIGNAVPVKLAEFVANALIMYIKSSKQIDKNKNEFLHWLVYSMNYSARSANDTLSRVRRANRICPITGIPDELYILTLQRNDQYSMLSTSVRSQIKRSLILYQKYFSQQMLV